MKYGANDSGSIPVLFVVLVALLVVSAGFAIHNVSKSRAISRVAASTPPSRVATPIPMVMPTSSGTTSPAPGSDLALISTAVSGECNAAGKTNAGATIDGSDIQGDLAKVSVHCNGYQSGYVDILKKTNDTWSIIFTGQQPPSKAFGEQHALPTSWYATN